MFENEETERIRTTIRPNILQVLMTNGDTTDKVSSTRLSGVPLL